MTDHKKPTYKWVNTRVEYRWCKDTNRYIEVECEGYWYDGPWALAHDVAPSWLADDYQFFEDDAGIGSATSLAAVNTAPSVAPGTQVRLRVNVGEEAGAAGTGEHSAGWTLQYKIDSGSWTTLGAATTVQYFDSSNLSNGTAIGVANYVLSYSGSAVQRDWGDECEDGVSLSGNIWSNDYCEIEYTVDLNTVSAGSQVTFRVLAPDGSTAVTFTNVPTIDISGDINVDATGAATAGEAQAPASVTGDANVNLTGAATAGEAGTVAPTVNRPAGVGPYQFASWGLDVNSYGSFTKGGVTNVNVNVTGAASAGEAQAVTITGDANYTLTGAESAGEAQAVTVTGDANVSITGAESAAQAGTVTPAYDWAETATGAESPGEAGTVTLTYDWAETATGAEVAGEAGTVTLTGDANVNVTGAASAAEAQAVTVTGDVNYTLTGAESAGEAEAVTVETGGNVNVNVTGAETAGEAQAVTVTGDVNITLTGAESAGEAGTVTVTTTSAVVPELGPHGLVHKPYGTFTRDLSVSLVGASTSATHGVVTPTGTTGVTVQFGPHGLVSKSRQFSPKAGASQNVDVNLVGAQIDGQAQWPDSANATIYVDGAASAAEAGTVQGVAGILVPVTGAAIAVEAGTVSVRVDVDVSITGAETKAETYAVDVAGDPNIEPTGAETAAEAGTVAAQADANATVTGAQINAQASEIGLDTSADVSVTVYSGTITGEAGTVTFLEAENEKPLGRYRRRPRYYVEVDGQYLVAYSQAEVKELLDTAVELAEEAEVTKPSVIRVKTGSGKPTQSKAIKKAVREAKQQINRAIEQRRAELQKWHAIDMEIAELLTLKLKEEEEEEEALLALLLS
jgi:hypothetical protein